MGHVPKLIDTLSGLFDNFLSNPTRFEYGKSGQTRHFFWGGGLLQPPLQISAVDRAITAKICIKVECDVNYKTVLLDYSLLLSFILYEFIMLIYAKNLIFTINH